MALPPPPVVTAKPANLEFVQILPDERQIALLMIATHSDFWTCIHFREQVHFILERLKTDPAGIIPQQDLAGHSHATRVQFLFRLDVWPELFIPLDSRHL
jgi:hypothetical protein